MDCKGCYPLLTTTPLNLTTFWKRLTGPLAQVLQWLLPTPTPSPPENISKKAHRPTSSWTERKVLLLDLRTFWKRLTGPLAHRQQWLLHTYPINILRKPISPLAHGLQGLLPPLNHNPSQPDNILKEAHRPTSSGTAMAVTYPYPLSTWEHFKKGSQAH